VNQTHYLKQKTSEISKLSKFVDDDIKNYRSELNKYSPEKNKKPWWNFW